MGWWSSLMRDRATQWTYLELPREDSPETVEADTAYLSVFLRSTYVVDVRRGLQRVYGAVQSSITLSDRDGGRGEFLSMVSPARLQDVDPAHLDRHIQLNHRLLGPVPYIGGDIEIEVGLFTLGSSYLTGPYLQLLMALTETATVTFFSAAAPFVEPLRQGIRALADSGEAAQLEIGFSTTWADLRPGWIVAARVDRLEPGELRVDARDGRLLDRRGTAVTDFPYMVLEVSTSTARTDWTTIPELATANQALQREYRNGDAERAAQAMTVLRRIALTCKDLLFDDALALVERLDRRYAEIGPPTPPVRGRGGGVRFPELAELSPFDND